ncbi:MAG: hypothetical protein WBX20_08010 [Terrimicrobiaceae bacterium]
MKTSDRIGSNRGAGSAHRISISLPAGELDRMVAERGVDNRVKAIAGMISAPAVKRRPFAGLRRNTRTKFRAL